jgi:hypothetical protein
MSFMIYTWSSFANFSLFLGKKAVGVHQMDVGVPSGRVLVRPDDSHAGRGLQNLYIWNRSKLKSGWTWEIVVGIEHVANLDEFLYGAKSPL